MGVASGCGCKEVYTFPHITYPYFSLFVLFCSSIPTFLFIFYSFLYVCIHIYVHVYTYVYTRGSYT